MAAAGRLVVVGLLGVALAMVDVAVKRLPDPLTSTADVGALAALTAGTFTGATLAALPRAVLAAAGLRGRVAEHHQSLMGPDRSVACCTRDLPRPARAGTPFFVPKGARNARNTHCSAVNLAHRWCPVKAIIAGASALILFMAVLCMGVVAFFFGGDDSTCTGTAGSGAAPSIAPSLNTPPSIHTSDMTWDTEQVHNAATIIDVGIHMGVPVRGWIIALAAAMQESNLVNLPDLGDANNADSLGLFQERPSHGWGTPDQIMDPVYASTAFYQHLIAVPGWQTMTVAQAAQAVERSAFPDAYSTWEPDATQLVAAVTGMADPSAAAPVLCAGGGGGGPVSLPSAFSLPPDTPPAAATAIMWTLGQLGTPYSFGGDCTAAHSGDPAHQCDCSSLVILSPRPGQGHDLRERIEDTVVDTAIADIAGPQWVGGIVAKLQSFHPVGVPTRVCGREVPR